MAPPPAVMALVDSMMTNEAAVAADCRAAPVGGAAVVGESGVADGGEGVGALAVLLVLMVLLVLLFL